MVHPTTRISHGRISADIDVELAPLILALWKGGVRTVYCCQDEGECWDEVNPSLGADVSYGRAHIEFKRPTDVCRFLELVANGGSRDADVFFDAVYPTQPTGWTFEVDFNAVEDVDGEIPEGPVKFDIGLYIVRFPRHQIVDITERVEGALRGEPCDQ